MIRHKDKARELLCPMKFAAIGILTSRGGAGSYPAAFMNRRSTDQETCNADGCMAWRWENFQLGRGYCGMAGIPPGIPKTED